MPIEIIKRMQKERDEEAAKQEKLRREEAERKRLAEKEVERKRVEAIERRRDFVVSTNTEIGQKSNLFNNLQRIDKELLEGNVKKHQLVYTAESGRSLLVWGNNFTVRDDGTIGGNYDYSSIEILIDPDKRTMTIEAKNKVTLGEKQWGDNKLVEQRLAEAYMDPERHFESHESSSSNESADGCCCCGR